MQKMEGKSPELSNNHGKSEKSLTNRSGMRWMGYGVEFVGVLGVFTYGGYRADQMLDTMPWFMVMGLITAFIGMVYLLYQETTHWRK